MILLPRASRPWPWLGRVWLPTLCLGMGLAAIAQQPPAQAPASALAPAEVKAARWWEQAKVPLHPKIEAALAEVAVKITPTRKKDLTEYMQSELEALLKLAAITDADKKKALQEAAAQAVEESIKPFPQRVTETNRVRVGLDSPDPDAAVLTISNWALDGIASNRLVLGCTAPVEQPVWTAAVKAALTPDQLAAWEKRTGSLRQEQEKEIEQCLTPWVNAARLKAKALMNTRIDAMAPVMKLDQDRLAKLREASDKVIEELCKEEEKRASESMRFTVPTRRKTYIQTNPVFRGYVLDADPVKEPHWLDALNSIASTEEKSRWDTHVAEEAARQEKEIPKMLELSLKRLQDSWEKTLESDITKMLVSLRLPPDRAKTLDPVKKTVLARAEKTWTRIATERFRKMDSGAREEIIKRGRGYFISLQNDDAPQNDPEWRKALGNLLSPEERKQLEIANAERKTRREDQMGRLLLAQYDKHIALTTVQREGLLPLARKLALTESRLFPAEETEYGYDFQPETFGDLAKQAKDEELRPFLDELQIKAWKNLAKIMVAAASSSSRQNQPPAPPKVDLGTRKPEPEDLEQIVSNFLSTKAGKEKAKLLNIMITAAEDAARITSLPPEAAARLKTAARGAMEATMEQWRSQVEQVLRSYIQGATVQDVGQRMAGIDDYYFNVHRNQKVEDQSLWQTALKTELNETLYKKWQGEQNARQAFQMEAASAFILAEFDRKVMLTREQSDKLQPLIQTLVTDYHVDFTNYFSGSDSTPWYMQYYCTLIPLVGIPEKDLKGIITPGQWDRWSKSSEYNNCMSYWGGLEQNHASRVKK